MDTINDNTKYTNYKLTQFKTKYIQEIEFAVHFGREVKRADIVIMDRVQPTVPYIVIEVKKPKLKDGKEQLKSYCNSTGATMAIWSNGEQTFL